MPTIHTALRAHYYGIKRSLRDLKRIPRYALTAEVVIKGKHKKRKNPVFRFSLRDRFKRIYPRSPRRTAIVVGAGSPDWRQRTNSKA